jgi:hypothetical protein
MGEEEFEQTSLDTMINDEPSEQPETPAEQESRARDDKGRFAKKGEQEEGASPAPEQRSDEYEGAATIGERRRRQDAEQQRDEYRTRLEALEQKFNQLPNPQQQEPAPLPDIWEDPEGRLAAERQQFQQALYQERYNNSLRFAETQHGKETVQQAVNWAAERAQRDQRFNMDALSHHDPVGFAVEQYRREEIATTVTPEELEAFRAWKANPQQPQQPSLPPTLSTERNAGQRTGPQWAGPTPLSEMLG